MRVTWHGYCLTRRHISRSPREGAPARIVMEVDVKNSSAAFFAVPLVLAAVGAVQPARGDAIVQGSLYENQDYTNPAGSTLLYSSAPVFGSPTGSTTTSWSYDCTTCSGYGISGSGQAKAIGGTLGAESSVTVTGSPSANYFGEADTYTQYDDTLTITGGTGGGVLALQYTVDGTSSHTGSGFNDSFAYLAMFDASGVYYQEDGGAITSGNQVFFSGEGLFADTVTFYIPFTYGSALDIGPIMRSAADFYTAFDGTPFTATWDFYNTATLDSALVLDGTADAPGSVNDGALISATSGLTYGASAAPAAPEPASWTLFAVALAALIGFGHRSSRA